MGFGERRQQAGYEGGISVGCADAGGERDGTEARRDGQVGHQADDALGGAEAVELLEGDARHDRDDEPAGERDGERCDDRCGHLRLHRKQHHVGVEGGEHLGGIGEGRDAHLGEGGAGLRRGIGDGDAGGVDAAGGADAAGDGAAHGACAHEGDPGVRGIHGAT